LVTYKGHNIEYETQVYTPDRVAFDFSSYTEKNKQWGYTSHLKYKLYNYFDEEMKKSVPSNEKFYGTAIDDYPNNDWVWYNTPSGATHVGLLDDIDGNWITVKKPTITFTKPANREQIHHWFGTWRIGSETPGKGKLVKCPDWGKGASYSTKCKWQRHRGFATHGFAEAALEKIK